MDAVARKAVRMMRVLVGIGLGIVIGWFVLGLFLIRRGDRE